MSRKILTTARVGNIADTLNSLTAGERGPVLLQEVHLIEKRR
jgi:catalase